MDRCHWPGGHESPSGPETDRQVLCRQGEEGLTCSSLLSPFHPCTERNDQTEQEERREIKQRLTRKVLGLSTCLLSVTVKGGREGAGLAWPPCMVLSTGFRHSGHTQQALEAQCLCVVPARVPPSPRAGLRAGPSGGLSPCLWGARHGLGLPH